MQKGKTMSKTRKMLVALTVVALAVPPAAVRATEYAWTVGSGGGTYASTCRKLVRVPSPYAAGDHIHLVFSDFLTGPNWYGRSRTGGQNWDPLLEVPFGYTPDGSNWPSLCVDPSVDRPWTVHAEQAGLVVDAIFAFVMQNWVPPTWVEANPGAGSFMQNALAISESDDPDNPALGYVVATYYDPEQFRSYLLFHAFDTLHYEPYFNAWLAYVNQYWDFMPTIDYTPGDNVHICYQTPVV